MKTGLTADEIRERSVALSETFKKASFTVDNFKMDEYEQKEQSERHQIVDDESKSDAKFYKRRTEELKEEVQKLRDIIRNGGLPNNCVSGWDEVKFCGIRNGDGDACLRCFHKIALG